MLYVLVHTVCKALHSQVFTCKELSKESLLELSISLAAVLFDLRAKSSEEQGLEQCVSFHVQHTSTWLHVISWSSSAVMSLIASKQLHSKASTLNTSGLMQPPCLVGASVSTSDAVVVVGASITTPRRSVTSFSRVSSS